ncbi:MAG: hypothetical protein ACYC1D_08045 [Acidimicrobiales bacterium]
MDEPGITVEAEETFARRLLATAASAAAAADDPRTARVIAFMLGSLAAEGYVGAVRSFLAPDPHDLPTFEVRTFQRGDISPAHERSGLDVCTALREASRLAEGDADLVEIVALGAGDLRRRVLERRQRESFHYLFPELGTYEGDEGRRNRAVAHWEAVINAPAAPSPEAHPSEDCPTGAFPPVEAPLSSDPRTVLDVATSAPPKSPVAQESVSQAVREALGDVTVEVDLGALEEVVSSALQRAIEEATTLAERTATPRALPAAAEPDPSARLERLLPELTERVAAVVDDRLQAVPSRDSGTEAPTARQIADLIAAQLRATRPAPQREMATTGDSPGGWVAQATLVAAAEQLHLQFETFNDRVRSSSRSLEALADELTARERAAATYTDRLAQSLNAGMDRLGRRVDARLDDLRAASSNDRTTAELARLIERLTDALQDLERIPPNTSSPLAAIRSLRPSADQP